MSMLTLSLPFPPSVNCLYAGKKRRYKSDRYKAWIEEASLYIKAGQPIEGRVDLLYVYDHPDNRERDVENYIKAVTDLLVSNGVLHNDSRPFIREVAARWSDKKGNAVNIAIESAPCQSCVSTKR